MKKQEAGSGGISFTMYFVAILLTIIMYSYTTFINNLYIIESEMKNGLHIIESATMTANQSEIINSERADFFEKELTRMKIISKSIYDDEKKDDEILQVNELGKTFQEYFEKQFKSREKKKMYKRLCGDDYDINILNTVIIYEPIYELIITRTELEDIQKEYESGYVSKAYSFDSFYNITGWIKYSLIYENDEYQYFTKELLKEAPTLSNKSIAEGATIEATLGVKFKGLRNIFANVNDGYLFSKNPSQQEYHLSITRSMDIVIADDDSRKQ